MLTSLPSSLRNEVEISAVVPCRNGAEIIADTVQTLDTALQGVTAQIIVIENGSTDDSREVLLNLSATWRGASDLLVLNSTSGLGYAYAAGVLVSTGQIVYLTADDLPFGTDDLISGAPIAGSNIIVIGSKGHPESRIERFWVRSLMTRLFRWLRTLILGTRVADSQGTFILNGNWAREFASGSRETGFLWTTELVYLAEQNGLRIQEIPVTFVPTKRSGPTRIRFMDVYDMFWGLLRIRWNKSENPVAMSQSSLVTYAKGHEA